MSFPVGFTDLSTPGPSGPITAWAWDFHDGGTSAVENPVHSFSTSGNHTVSLMVTGSGTDGTATTTQTVDVIDFGVLTANFSSSVSGLAVTFTDLSTPGPSGPITGWSWNFGDSGTSTSQNPSHTYSGTGTYSVTLTVTGTSPDGTANTSQPTSVSSGPAPPGPPVSVGALIFSDEFNGVAGSKPNSTTNWNIHTGHAGLGIGYWNGVNNVELDGSGNLVITAVKSGSVWNSAFLTSKPGWTGQRYLETRAKMAPGFGTWNAPLWEWNWPFGAAGGIENDVLEQLGREPQVGHTTIHNFTVSPQRQSGHANTAGVTLSNAFHIYGCALFADHADYYVDGTLVWTIHASDVGLSNLTTYKCSGNIQLNMGGWGGTPTIPGPVSMLVDYVRVYVAL